MTTTLLIAALLSGVIRTGALAQQDTVVIAHTNDFHGYLQADGDRSAGAARIAATFDSLRLAHGELIVLDAGDCVSGTPVSSLFNGDPIFEVMNAMRYDAVTIGNHEFDYGWRKILDYRELVDFPLLSCNALDPQGHRIADRATVLLERAGLRVGVVGATTDSTPHMVSSQGNEGIEFADQIEAVRAAVDSLRNHCDLLIALTHLGAREDGSLAAQVTGIDLIVGGHSHDVISPPMWVEGTPIVQAGSYGSHVGVTRVIVDDDRRVVDVIGEVIPATSMPRPNPRVAKLVDEWEAKVSTLVDVEISRTDDEWSRDEMYDFVEHVLRTCHDADVGYYNRGGIRAAFTPGPITKRHIWNTHPFGNRIAVVSVLGAEIGGRLKERFADQGLPIDPDRIYRVATNTFVIEEIRIAKHFGAPLHVQIHDDLVRDVVIDDVQNYGVADRVYSPYAPSISDVVGDAVKAGALGGGGK
ncbi:MAG: bifunctional UDP-sugar hydrolase/5'-nucleotidase [Candidatus Latescibacterota bacterium]|nr:bifunctional UDP-sugar hydrolase/5'-nucleotidase [Candidatus Latescibacterota bacterium]